MDCKELLQDTLPKMFPGAGISFTEFRGDLAATLESGSLLEVCDYLRNEPALNFELLEDVTAIDWATRKDRFTVVYIMFSLPNKFRLRLNVPLRGNAASVPSVAAIWKSADWAEREVYDMYGITFDGHPDLRRMYMPEEFEYHPLRKEFPLMGIPGSLPLPKK